jgi:hypothetical protein
MLGDVLFGRMRRHTDDTNGLQVGANAVAEREGCWLVLGGVGDSVGLTGLNTSGRVGVDGDCESRGHEGSARKDGLEETHVDGSID